MQAMDYCCKDVLQHNNTDNTDNTVTSTILLVITGGLNNLKK